MITTKGFIKEKFGFDVSQLDAWHVEDRLPLLSRSLFDSNTADFVTLETGVKTKTNLNIFDDSVYMTDGKQCGFDPTGDIAFTKRELEVAPIKIEKEYCVKDLMGYWTQTLLPVGLAQEDMPQQQRFMMFIAGLIARANEIAYWQGDKTLVNPNLNKFDGYLKHLTVAGIPPVINGNIGNVNFGVTTAITAIDNMVTALPDDLLTKPDLAIYMSPSNYASLLVNLRNSNNFHIDGADASPYNNGFFSHPTWGLPVVRIMGLTGKKNIVLARRSNMYLGTDLAGEQNDFDVWYNRDTDTVRVRVQYQLGTQIAFPSEVVHFINNP
jgi:hypothetical protein